VAEQAFAQNHDVSRTHWYLLYAANVEGDRVGAEKQIQWLAGKPDEYQSLLVQGWNAGYLGQLRKGRELIQRGAGIAR
jgi:hypothetical protein